MSMAEAAQAAAAAGGGPAAADISMAESGGDDQDLAYGRALEGSTDIVVSTFLFVFLHSRLLFFFGDSRSLQNKCPEAPKVTAHFNAALQMSMQEAAAAASAAQGSADVNQVLGDQSFVSSVLSSVRTFSTVKFRGQCKTVPHWL